VATAQVAVEKAEATSLAAAAAANKASGADRIELEALAAVAAATAAKARATLEQEIAEAAGATAAAEEARVNHEREIAEAAAAVSAQQQAEANAAREAAEAANAAQASEAAQAKAEKESAEAALASTALRAADEAVRRVVQSQNDLASWGSRLFLGIGLGPPVLLSLADVILGCWQLDMTPSEAKAFFFSLELDADGKTKEQALLAAYRATKTSFAHANLLEWFVAYTCEPRRSTGKWVLKKLLPLPPYEPPAKPPFFLQPERDRFELLRFRLPQDALPGDTYDFPVKGDRWARVEVPSHARPGRFFKVKVPKYVPPPPPPPPPEPRNDPNDPWAVYFNKFPPTVTRRFGLIFFMCVCVCVCSCSAVFVKPACVRFFV
jgi:hypothetical protein